MADTQTNQTVASLLKRIEILETRETLRTVINTYTAAADAGDAALLSTVFAEDGVLASSWFGEIDGLATISQGIASGKDWGHLMHSVTNVQLDVDGSDTATGSAYLSFYAVKDKRKLGENFAFGGPYRFRFVRRDGRWLIVRLDLDRWWEQGVDETGAFH